MKKVFILMMVFSFNIFASGGGGGAGGAADYGADLSGAIEDAQAVTKTTKADFIKSLGKEQKAKLAKAFKNNKKLESMFQSSKVLDPKLLSKLQSIIK